MSDSKHATVTCSGCGTTWRMRKRTSPRTKIVRSKRMRDGESKAQERLIFIFDSNLNLSITCHFTVTIILSIAIFDLIVSLLLFLLHFLSLSFCFTFFFDQFFFFACLFVNHRWLVFFYHFFFDLLPLLFPKLKLLLFLFTRNSVLLLMCRCYFRPDHEILEHHFS